MKLSKKTIYAIMLVLSIAKNGSEGSLTMREIAERENLSLKYLEQIVNVLCKAGLVKSRRGSKGGYSLSMPAEKYTIGSIIRAMEGRVSADSFDESQTLKYFFEGLCDTVNRYIDSVTINDLIEEEKTINNIFDYCI